MTGIAGGLTTIGDVGVSRATTSHPWESLSSRNSSLCICLVVVLKFEVTKKVQIHTLCSFYDLSPFLSAIERNHV